MIEALSLQAELREQSGSKAAAAVRRNGRIPAIVYGHKQEAMAISLDAHDFVEGLRHGHRLMEVAIGGNAEKMIIKELQYDHLGRTILHADLMRVDVTERITMDVPLELKGVPKGAQEGGVLESHLDHLEVECLAVDIPESIVVSVKDLDVGQSIFARDVKLPEGVTLVDLPDQIVATCRILAEAKTTEQIEAETPVAPEVIRERAPAEEEAGE
ncbi:MAG: 50S ribosomal protein L25 [Planctomycetes bacterium]|nr:50S ribosomal protein L25 [Planctomycetota bacterium]